MAARLIFMGSPEFAIPSLELLCASGFDIVAVVTQPDRPSGRGMKMASPPVKIYAEGAGLKVMQPRKANSLDFIEAINRLEPDLAVVVAFGQILSANFLKVPKHGCINLHASLLPKYRGAAPINWSIIKGETLTGLTVMLLDEGLDTGPILSQQEVPIGAADDAITLSEKMSRLGAELLHQTILRHLKGEIKPKEQAHEHATYAPKLRKSDALVDWAKSPLEIHNLIKGTVPWPVAYTYHRAMALRIWRAGPMDAESGRRPGEVLWADKRGIAVSCGHGALLMKELQPENRRAMTAVEYAAGYRVRAGEVFGGDDRKAQC